MNPRVVIILSVLILVSCSRAENQSSYNPFEGYDHPMPSTFSHYMKLSEYDYTKLCRLFDYCKVSESCNDVNCPLPTSDSSKLSTQSSDAPDLFIYDSGENVTILVDRCSIRENVKAKINLDLIFNESITSIKFNLFDGVNYTINKTTSAYIDKNKNIGDSIEWGGWINGADQSIKLIFYNGYLFIRIPPTFGFDYHEDHTYFINSYKYEVHSAVLDRGTRTATGNALFRTTISDKEFIFNRIEEIKIAKSYTWCRIID